MASFDYHLDPHSSVAQHYHPSHSAIDHLTLAEIQATNETAKPNFGWERAAEVISRDDRKWDGGELGTAGSVTYSFLSNSQADAGYYQLSSAQIAGAQAAMAVWSQVANVTFTWADTGNTQVYSSAGEIDFQAFDGGNGGWASYGWYLGGPTRELSDATVALGGDDFSLALHEIGHAIGLSHPGNYDGGGSNYSNNAGFFEDSEQFSVMSYWDASHTGADLYEWRQSASGEWHAIGGATGLGLYDIAAIQRIYGVNTTTYTGDTIYGFNSNTGDDGWTLNDEFDWIQAAIWDTGGVDTIDGSGYAENSHIDLRPLSFSSLGALKDNLSIAKGVQIENAVGGSGADVIIGNVAANVILGRGGNDTLNGLGGADTISGEGGSDEIFGGDGVDVLNGNNGNDTLRGEAGRDQLFGGANADILFGGVGADLINGGTGVDFVSYTDSTSGIGLDILAPGTNSGDAAGDVLQLIENIVGSNFNDTIKGGNVANEILGRGGNDTIEGRDGADVITGGGGGDTMTGGAGADVFRYEGASQSTNVLRDTITDFAGAGAPGGDRIDLSVMDADNTTAGNQAFTFIGNNVAFSGSAGEVRLSGNTVEGDINGNGVGNFYIDLTGVAVMSSDDFIV